MTDKEIMQMALDALETHAKQYPHMVKGYTVDAVQALRAALAQPEPKPVAWADKHDVEREGHDFWVSRQQPAKDGVPLYTAQREWVGLTENEFALFKEPYAGILQWVETTLKEKNNG